MVPCNVQGVWLCDRVDEWHQQNPGQMASQMILEVAAAQSVPAPASVSACQSSTGYPPQQVGQYPEVSQTEAYALRQVPAPRPDAAGRPRPAHENTASTAPGSHGHSRAAAPTSLPRDLPPHLPQEGASPIKTSQEASAQETSRQAHPFTTIQGTTNAPRTTAPAQPWHEQAYTTTAKIHDEKVAADIYNHAMELPITVTQHKLLSLAPELRTQVTNTTIKWHVPRDMVQVLIKEINKREEENTTQLLHMPAAFATAANPQYQKAITMEPHKQHLKTVQTVQDPQEEVEVAAESNVLHAILPVIDGQDQVEAILDLGCQVVAMSEEVCNTLAITYDLDIRLSMVSANGGVNQSLRLACNISFLVGDITLYFFFFFLNPFYSGIQAIG
jgi:hypothetical protein